MVTVPVGRASEWRRFVDWMATGQSGLVVIQGEPGTGRTHLMQAFGSHARAEGFEVAGCDEQIPIEETTRISDIVRALAALLALEEPPERSESGSGVLSTFISAFKASYHNERDLLKILERRNTFVGIDGYAPHHNLESWMLSLLSQWMPQAPHQVVFTFVDRESRLANVREHAAIVFALHELDGEELHEYFAGIGTELSPALSPEEVECYAEASRDPTVFQALDDVLAAVRGVG